ncbi:MAG: terminase small subunit [Rhodospirillales bacterium]|nr:terminase small subunit [Rhodospirillales bacterium]
MAQDNPPTPAIAGKPTEKPQEARTGAARTGTQQEARTGAAQTEKPLRSRHEAFCQHFVLRGNATDAAIQAGYTPRSASNQGYRLQRQPRIRARIAEIQGGLAHAYCLDQAVLIGKLEAVYQRAIDEHKFHVATRAVELQAHLGGLIKGRIPDREIIIKTINDDFLRPVSGQVSLKSRPCEISGRRK